MTRNQLHGKKFEDLIKGCGLFPGASDQSRSSTVGMDIEARFDRMRELPTSIKATGSGVVTLSDARRFWAIEYPFRMLVGVYVQEENQKRFSIIHEFILLPADLGALRGNVTGAEVEALHVGIGLSAFPAGRHAEARAWIVTQKRELQERNSKVTLTPKIDSKRQRRMQCSLRLLDLTAVTERQRRHIVHTNKIGDLVLPFSLVSPPRK